MKVLNQWLAGLKETACPDMEECVEMLGQLLPWLHDFEDTPQEPDWHAEGNVHIHTSMVLNECYNILKNEATHIQGSERQALILSALLHDIAKPVCTVEKEVRGVMRLAATGHEAKGRSYLAYRLCETDLSDEVINQVLDLVGEHHIPKLLVIRDADSSGYYALARKVSLELLYYLELADMRGRDCIDKDKQLEILEEFKMFAQDYGLWDTSSPYQALAKPLCKTIDELAPNERQYVYQWAIADFEHNRINMLEEAIGKTWQHREAYSHAVILCGPSGSGKSSWVNKHLKDYDVVSLDVLREKINGKRGSQKNPGQVMQQAKALWRESLRNKRNVVWDATNLRKDFRTMIADLARDYGALVTLVVFRLPVSQLFRNNASRQHEVPEQVLQKQLDGAQWPTIDEAHRYRLINTKGETVFDSYQVQKQPLCSNS